MSCIHTSHSHMTESTQPLDSNLHQSSLFFVIPHIRRSLLQTNNARLHPQSSQTTTVPSRQKDKQPPMHPRTTRSWSFLYKDRMTLPLNALTVNLQHASSCLVEHTRPYSRYHCSLLFTAKGNVSAYLLFNQWSCLPCEPWDPLWKV